MDVAKIEEMFDGIDEDEDGFITRRELRAGLKALRVPYSSRTLEVFIKACDRDDDDMISKSEFIGFVLIRREALRNAFRKLDATADGRISAQDIRTAATSMSIALSDAEAARLIRVADSDGDGFVSEDEFVDLLLLVGDTHIEGLFEHWQRHESGLVDFDAPAEPPSEAMAGEPAWHVLLAGGLAGVVSRTVTAPMDRLRTVLQAADPRGSGRTRPGKAPQQQQPPSSAATTTTTTTAAAGASGRGGAEQARSSGRSHLSGSRNVPHPHNTRHHHGQHNTAHQGVTNQGRGGGVVAALDRLGLRRKAPESPAFLSADEKRRLGLEGNNGGSRAWRDMGEKLSRATRTAHSHATPPVSAAQQAHSALQAHALAAMSGVAPSHPVAAEKEVSAAARAADRRQRQLWRAAEAANHHQNHHAPRPIAPQQSAGAFARAAMAALEAAPAAARDAEAAHTAGKNAAKRSTVRATASARLLGAGGIGPAARAILAEGGVWAFWRGNGTNVLKIAPETAVRFYAFDWAKQRIAADPHRVTALERFAAGAFAGVVSTITVYPLEIAKTRLALSNAGEFRGIVDCLVSLARHEGLPAVYRGLGASLMGIIPYSGTELMTFTLLRDAYAARFPEMEPGVGTLLTCGAIASLAGQVVAFPLQLARTRLQAQGLPGRESLKYTGVFDCLSTVLRRDGVQGLYRGMLPGFLKSIPSCMVSFAVFEQARGFLNRRAGHSSKNKKMM